MSKQHDAESLVEAILDGELAFEAALEEHLDDDDADLERIYAALCYFNLGQLGRVLDLPDGPMVVAQVIEQFGLGPFATLLNDKEPDRHGEIRYPVGALVDFSGDVCKVIGRRRTTILAMPAEDDFEVFLESVDGKPKYFVGESMVSEVEPDDEA
jgi:hypothetical protein